MLHINALVRIALNSLPFCMLLVGFYIPIQLFPFAFYIWNFISF